MQVTHPLHFVFACGTHYIVAMLGESSGSGTRQDRSDMQRRWLLFHVISLVLACGLVALTWDLGIKWYALLVPLCIALSPLLMRNAFLNARSRAGEDEWRIKTAYVVGGMAFVELLNLVLGCQNLLPWSFVAIIL